MSKQMTTWLRVMSLPLIIVYTIVFPALIIPTLFPAIFVLCNDKHQKIEDMSLFKAIPLIWFYFFKEFFFKELIFFPKIFKRVWVMTEPK